MAGDGEQQASASAEPDKPKSWRTIILCTIGFFLSLNVFLVGLQLLGDAVKCLGGKGAGSMFTAISNPIAGLMTGILATVMVQSSSTSTSIVVGLVGSDQISVRTGIPIIMGANMGTSVTNTIVSMGQSGDRIQLERAFAGATVHDMFNYLSVACMLPLEIIVAAIQGEGGPLYWITKAIADAAMGGNGAGDLFESPIKVITKPVAELFIKNNKYVINALSLGEPDGLEATRTNNATCAGRRLAAWPGGAAAAEGEVADSEGSRSLLSRRLADSEGKDCSRYYCVSKDLDKSFKKISKKGYKTKLTRCDGYILEPEEPCKGRVCYLDADQFYEELVANGRIIKDGFTRGAGDVGGGIIALIFALLLLIGGLFALCKLLSLLLMGKAKRVITKATKLNDYAAMTVGIVTTIVVQSSSVVTSALTPFCGMGVLPLEKMMPLTLGANIGTTVTALIAALATFTHDAVHIALCHLFFNIFGILIWFPIPPMRRIPLGAARLLGLYASYYRFVPLLYIIVAFILVPGIALGISALFDATLAGGIVVLVIVLLALGGFMLWWTKIGCYKVLSREDREKGERELEKANAEVLEEDPPRDGGAQWAAGNSV